MSKRIRKDFGYRGYPEIFTPDQNSPVVFKMWKVHGAEPLVKTSISTAIPCDGTPILFDLLKGKRVENGGHIRVIFQREPLHIERGKNKAYSWNLMIEAIDGEIKTSGDEFMYIAPAGGYLPSVTINMPKESESWTSTFEQSLYLKIRGEDQFARVNLSLTADYEPPPTGFSLESWLNPSGSRNLEYDPQKTIIPQRIEQIGLEKAIEEVKSKAP